MEADELERLETWQRMFRPAGAVLAARTDQEHWLTFGIGAALPVLDTTSRVFMSSGNVRAAVRAGVYRDVPPSPRFTGASIDLAISLSAVLRILGFPIF